MSFKEWKQRTLESLSNGMKQSSQFLAGFKQKSSNNLVALDIGPDFLKLLKLTSSDQNNRIEHFSIVPLPQGAVVKDEIKNPAEIASILRDMFRTAQVTTKEVALAIPRSSTIIKTIYVDKRLNSEDIESRAWIEANRLFPDLVGDIYLDFAVTGSAPQDESQLELVIVACRKDQIEPYLNVLNQAGLTAKVVDVNCYALERALSLVNTVQPVTTIALLNLNSNLSTFVVLNNQVLIHAHDQSYDGQRLCQLTEEYLKNRNIQPTDKNDFLNEDGYNEILKERLISHLRHTIHFFYSSKPNISIQKMVLAGDCAQVPGLAAFIQREIGIQTVIADPFVNMILPFTTTEEEMKKHAPGMMLCCGLALNE